MMRQRVALIAPGRRGSRASCSGAREGMTIAAGPHQGAASDAESRGAPSKPRTEELRTKMKKKLLWSLLTLSLFSPSAARASTGFVGLQMSYAMNGSACVPVFGSDGMISYSQFGVHNTSTTSAAQIICPLTPAVTNLGAALGAKPNSAGNCTCDPTVQTTMMVYDRSLAGDVSCSLMILNPNGFVSQSWSATSSGFSSDVQTLTFPAACAAVGGGLTLAVTCSLPPMTQVGFSHMTTVMLPFCSVQSLVNLFP
jgi:hypothetical protein